MKLLVTGGLGFIGSNFIRLMLHEHDDIHILNIDDLRLGSNPENLRDLDDERRYEFCRGDIADEKLIAGLVKDADAIVNFAAETHVDRSIARPESFLHSNVQGVFNLLEALRHHNSSARFVQISTDEVYGDILRGSFTEESTLKPSSPYSASKAAGDVFVQAYSRTYGLEAMVTRCTNNYGPYQFPEKLIPLIILNALEGKSLPVYGDGKNVRDWLYVVDHARAIDVIFHRGKPGDTYNIGGFNEWKNIDLIKVMIKTVDKLLGNPEGHSLGLITYVTDRAGHDLRYAIDSTKLKNELGWEPSLQFEEGIEKTVKWYLENQEWMDNVTSGEYEKYYENMYGK